jgi:hypothetical protein
VFDASVRETAEKKIEILFWLFHGVGGNATAHPPSVPAADALSLIRPTPKTYHLFLNRSIFVPAMQDVGSGPATKHLHDGKPCPLAFYGG